MSGSAVQSNVGVESACGDAVDAPSRLASHWSLLHTKRCVTLIRVANVQAHRLGCLHICLHARLLTKSLRTLVHAIAQAHRSRVGRCVGQDGHSTRRRSVLLPLGVERHQQRL
jgi:hypothetical protein